MLLILLNLNEWAELQDMQEEISEVLKTSEIRCRAKISYRERYLYVGLRQKLIFRL